MFHDLIWSYYLPTHATTNQPGHLTLTHQQNMETSANIAILSFGSLMSSFKNNDLICFEGRRLITKWQVSTMVRVRVWWCLLVCYIWSEFLISFLITQWCWRHARNKMVILTRVNIAQTWERESLKALRLSDTVNSILCMIYSVKTWRILTRSSATYCLDKNSRESWELRCLPVLWQTW